MVNASHSGNTVTVLAPYTVASGGGVLVGSIFGVAAYDAVLNDSLEVARLGVFNIAKDANAAAQGASAYWDDVNKVVTAVPNTTGKIGYFETAALAGDTTGAVVLTGIGVSKGMDVAHAVYNFVVDGGASCTPVVNATIPANAIIIGATINSTTAPLAAGSATVGIGTTAGSTTTSILAATAKASLTIDALLNGVPTLAAPVKMSAAGQISVLIATGPLTAGVIEVFVYYVQALNA
jgi:predicted RecA/RadA family phage recombinase